MTFREPRKGRISAPARGACDSETVTSGNRESNPNGSSTATRETNRNRSVTTFQREGSEGEEVCASIEKTNHEARGLRPSRPARGQPALCAPKPLLRQNPAGVRKIRRGERSFAWWFAFRQETHTFPNPASLHFWKTVTPCLLLVCSPTPYVVFERGRGTSRGGHNPSFVEERTRWLQTDFPSVGRSVVSARGGGITHSSTAAPAAGSVAILRYGRVLRRGIRPGLGVSSRPIVT